MGSECICQIPLRCLFSHWLKTLRRLEFLPKKKARLLKFPKFHLTRVVFVYICCSLKFCQTLMATPGHKKEAENQWIDQRHSWVLEELWSKWHVTWSMENDQKLIYFPTFFSTFLNMHYNYNLRTHPSVCCHSCLSLFGLRYLFFRSSMAISFLFSDVSTKHQTAKACASQNVFTLFFNGAIRRGH